MANSNAEEVDNTEREEQDEQEDILQRHRREKKLLQNKIQGLKKSSGKLDKKKKKELDETICKLESELEQTHLKELSEVESRNPINPTNSSPSNEAAEKSTADPRAGRVSKAQKRREKKAADEVIRQKELLEQDKANEHGVRAKETKAIVGLLRARGLALHPVPSDGDCLYAAVSHQTGMSVPHLRGLTAQRLREDPDSFLPYLCLDPEQYEKYCDDVANTASWGGQVELQALCSKLRRPIHVVQAETPTTIVQGEEHSSEGPPLIVAYHRHMYGLGEHYNSTRELTDQDLQDQEDQHPDQ